MLELDEKTLYTRSKLILSAYRDICWSTAGRADQVREDLICYCGSQLDDALIYLETFAPDEARERFAYALLIIYLYLPIRPESCHHKSHDHTVVVM